jgi:hypothetical protein
LQKYGAGIQFSPSRVGGSGSFGREKSVTVAIRKIAILNLAYFSG